MRYDNLSPEFKEALVVKAKNCGYSTETLYGNCIQSTLNGIYRAFPDFGVTVEMLKSCFGMAGGTGCTLDGTCGALNGAAMIISLAKGRPIDDLDGDYDECHEIIRDITEKFRQKYGGILCKEVLNHNLGGVFDWKTEEGDRKYMESFGTHHCAATVSFCTELIARMIVNGELELK